MNNIYKIGISLLSFSILLFFSCKEEKQDKLDTIIEGKATIYVDESIFPIVEDAQAVFETQYNAKLTLVPKSEKEIINALFNDSSKIAVLTRNLSTDELKVFENKKIFPKTTPFATDAIALIKNKKDNDTLVSLQDVIDFMKGKSILVIKGLVFDNANSSSVRYMSDLSKSSITNNKNIFSFNSNEEVIKYVAKNNGMIGVVGMNWIYQPPLDLQKYVDKVNVMSVKDRNGTEYISPIQDNLAMGKYPLARHLYIINCQGYSGLGMGFASFLGGERGQRIILKSGLVPERYPSRKILIRKEINKDNK